MDKPVSAHKIRDALNYHLRPQPIAILDVEPVSEEFHARFSATGRRYVYQIVNRFGPLTIDCGLAWHIIQPLDEAAMAESASLLVGCHDFTTFRHCTCQASSPIKTLDRLDVKRDGTRIAIEAHARSFLHRQVRSMVGSLILVGLNKWSIDAIRTALDACDRRACGPTAPPGGLYLLGVDYLLS